MKYLSIVVLAMWGIASAQDVKTPFKPGPSKEEETKKYHPRKVRGTSAALRMQAYQQRLKMEDESPFGNVKWRAVGPEYQGGRVIDIEVPKNAPNTMFVAYATGGLWRSDDNWNTLTPLFDQQSAYAIGDIAVSKDGKTIWVGTGENNSQRTSYSGTGVFKSTDGGQSWQHMGLEETHRIGRIVIDPNNENVVYVAAVGSLYSVNPERGLYKTTDGGKTWRHVLRLDDQTGVIDVVMHPKNSNVLLASAWDRDRRAWNFRESGPGSAIFKSTDGGSTWKKCKDVPNGQYMGRVGLGASQSKPGVVYAFIDDQGPDVDQIYRDERTPTGTLTANRFAQIQSPEQFLEIPKDVIAPFVTRYLPNGTDVDDLLAKVKDKKMSLEDIAKAMEQRNPNVFTYDIVDAAIWRSEDFGESWKRMSRYIGAHGGYYGGQVIVNPKNENDVVTLGVQCLRSFDGGKNWTSIARGNHVDHHAFWFDPSDPKRQANGNDGGLYVTANDGGTWRHINSIPVGQFTTLAIDNARPYNIIGGLQDNGTLMGPSNYRSGARQSFFNPQTGWSTVGGGDGSACAIDPRDNGVIYVASQFGAHSAVNRKTNERWNTRPSERGSRDPLRFNWVSPMVISTHHPDIIYIGGNKLFRSLNMGRSWEALSGDLTKNLPNGDVPFSTMKDLSESPLKFGLIYVGCDDGTVKMTKDHGNTWVEIPTPQPDKWVSRIVASKWDLGTVYVSQSGYREDDWTPYLYKSTDFGKTWVSIASNLPMETINVVREDPNRKGMLYVGTDMGVFVSFDDGGKWEPLSGGIPRAPVHDLQVQARDEELAIATHSRSVWTFDLKPVYAVDADLRAKDLYIWPVDNLTWSSSWAFRRPGFDGQPPSGPLVPVKVWSNTRGSGKLRVKDKDGKVVVEKDIAALTGYNYFDFSIMLNPGNVSDFDPKKREVKTGADVIKDPYDEARPKFLGVGTYTIEVTVGAKMQTVTWKIEA